MRVRRLTDCCVFCDASCVSKAYPWHVCSIVEYTESAMVELSIRTLAETQLQERNITVRTDRRPGEERRGGGGEHGGGGPGGGYGGGYGGGPGPGPEHGGERFPARGAGPPRDGGSGAPRGGGGGGGGAPQSGDPVDAVVQMRGMPWKATERDIVEFFGNLTVVDRGVRIIRNPDGRASGDAFVVFATASEAEQALGKHRQHMGPRYVEIYQTTVHEMEEAMKRTNYQESPPMNMGPPPRDHGYDRGGGGYDRPGFGDRGGGRGGYDRGGGYDRPGYEGPPGGGGGGGWGGDGPPGGGYGMGPPPRDHGYDRGGGGYDRPGYGDRGRGGYDRDDERRRFRREDGPPPRDAGRGYGPPRDNSPPRGRPRGR